MLLNIPPQKTLLRRHLTTNFNVLIGPETQQEKRDITESTAYTPLTTTAKVRVCAALENEILQNLSLTLLFLIRKTCGERSVLEAVLCCSLRHLICSYLLKFVSEINMQSCPFSEGNFFKTYLKWTVTPPLKTIQCIQSWIYVLEGLRYAVV